MVFIVGEELKIQEIKYTQSLYKYMNSSTNYITSKITSEMLSSVNSMTF